MVGDVLKKEITIWTPTFPDNFPEIERSRKEFKLLSQYYTVQPLIAATSDKRPPPCNGHAAIWRFVGSEPLIIFDKFSNFQHFFLLFSIIKSNCRSSKIDFYHVMALLPLLKWLTAF